MIDTYKGHVAASQIYATSARGMYMGVLEQQELSLCLSEDEKVLSVWPLISDLMTSIDTFESLPAFCLLTTKQFPMAPLLSAIASALDEPSGARPVPPFRPASAVALGSWAAQVVFDETALFHQQKPPL